MARTKAMVIALVMVLLSTGCSTTSAEETTKTMTAATTTTETTATTMTTAETTETTATTMTTAETTETTATTILNGDPAIFKNTNISIYFDDLREAKFLGMVGETPIFMKQETGYLDFALVSSANNGDIVRLRSLWTGEYENATVELVENVGVVVKSATKSTLICRMNGRTLVSEGEFSSVDVAEDGTTYAYVGEFLTQDGEIGQAYVVGSSFCVVVEEIFIWHLEVPDKIVAYMDTVIVSEKGRLVVWNEPDVGFHARWE